MKNLSATLLVSGEFKEDGSGFLAVAVKDKNDTPQIINVLQGAEAYTIFQKLITPDKNFVHIDIRREGTSDVPMQKM